jgi:hypothetical protein
MNDRQWLLLLTKTRIESGRGKALGCVRGIRRVGRVRAIEGLQRRPES